jgi:hypothetical protein
MVNVWLLPLLAFIHPAGEIVPCSPATALIIKVSCVAADAALQEAVDSMTSNIVKRKHLARQDIISPFLQGVVK